MTGVGFDLGKEFARRIGVPFEPVLYPSVGALLDSGKSGAWDVAFVGFSPERAKDWDFSARHLEVEFGYLVPGELPFKRSPGRIVFFSHPDQGRDRSSLEQSRGGGTAAIRKIRRICWHQANPLRDVESIVWLTGSRRSARHRSTRYGDAEGA
jgi:hypothetical protein